MKIYTATFTGRTKGAIGIFYKITSPTKGKTEEEAWLALYDRFDHIRRHTLEEVTSPTLYQEIMASGIEIASHESDLYFPASGEALAILDRYPLQKGNASRFTNEAPPHVGELWVDVPFAYDPFWKGRRH